MYPSAKTHRHLGLCRGNQLWIILIDWQGSGRSGCAILPSSCQYRPHVAGSKRNVGPTSVSCFGEMALGKLPYSSRSRTGHSRCQVLPCSDTQEQQAPACLRREHKAEDEWWERERSLPSHSESCWPHPSLSGSKGGNRPVDVSLVGQLWYYPVSPLIRSNDVACARKRPWDVNTKDASQLKWLGPGTMKCQPCSDVTIADSTCVATGAWWQDFSSQPASLVL